MREKPIELPARLLQSFNEALNCHSLRRRNDLFGDALQQFRACFQHQVASTLRRFLGRVIAVDGDEVNEVFQNLFKHYWSRFQRRSALAERITGSSVVTELVGRLFGTELIRGEIAKYADALFRKERPLLADNKHIFNNDLIDVGSSSYQEEYDRHRAQVLLDIANPTLRETAEIVFAWVDKHAENGHASYFEPFIARQDELKLPSDLEAALLHRLGLVQPKNVANRVSHVFIMCNSLGLFSLPVAPQSAVDVLREMKKDLPRQFYYKVPNRVDRATVTACVEFYLGLAEEAQSLGKERFAPKYPSYESGTVDWDDSLVSFLMQNCAIAKGRNRPPAEVLAAHS